MDRCFPRYHGGNESNRLWIPVRSSASGAQGGHAFILGFSSRGVGSVRISPQRGWRWIYVVTAQLALYFNVFVLVVQAFEKISALKALAPTQKEAPFLMAQLIVLLAFVVLTIVAVRRFRIDQSARASSAS